MKPASGMNKSSAFLSPSASSANVPVIACFGEIVWDCLPRGIFLGGAPLNVAYHLKRLGLDPRLISAVGWDFLGEEALRRLSSWNLDLSFIARRGNPTGTVRATLSDSGVAHYIFDPSPAWEHISVSLSALAETPPPTAIVFGTLACRESSNRNMLDTLLGAWRAAPRVVDLNLRPPFDQREAVDFALARASLLKLNDEELSTLLQDAACETPAAIAEAAFRLAKLRRIERICVTAGAKGAGLLWDGTWHWASARPVKVCDTVGAGDAFLAGLLAALFLRRETPERALAAACRLGEYVATQDGATPSYRLDASGQPAPADVFTGDDPRSERLQAGCLHNHGVDTT